MVIYGCDVIGGTWPNVMGGSYQHPTDEGAEKVINRQGVRLIELVSISYMFITYYNNVWWYGKRVVSLLWCFRVSCPPHLGAGRSPLGPHRACDGYTTKVMIK